MSHSAHICGSCSLCCKLIAVEELAKPAGQWCQAFKPGAGCSIYETRPLPCRAFQCLWLRREEWPDDWRPDRAHFVMVTAEEGQQLSIVVDPATPHAWKKEPYYSRFKAMTGMMNQGRRVIICIGARRIVVLPDQDIDLGDCSDEDRVESGFRDEGGRIVSYARVVRGAGAAPGDRHDPR